MNPQRCRVSERRIGKAWSAARGVRPSGPQTATALTFLLPLWAANAFGNPQAPSPALEIGGYVGPAFLASEYPLMMVGGALGFALRGLTRVGTVGFRVGTRANVFATEYPPFSVEGRLGVEWDGLGRGPVKGFLTLDGIGGGYNTDPGTATSWIGFAGPCVGGGLTLGAGGAPQFRLRLAEVCALAPGALALSFGAELVVFSPR